MNAIRQQSLPAVRRLSRLCGVLLCLCTAASATDIYKYTAPDGTVTYSALKPRSGAYEKLEPSCLLSYIGCELSASDWARVPLNHNDYHAQIRSVAAQHGLEAALVRAVVHAESNFNHKAVSRAGAQGLMQLMPKTQRTLGVRDPYDIGENLNGGTRLLKELLVRYRHNVKLAVAAYNAGPDAVDRHQGIPPYPETRNYVRRVTQLYSRYKETL
ncbi:MAG: lytic transglycosylase [Gammaproteobacteria bacterium HGW-Gammaproteobacteria-1]|jgi:soluble lytic murein transglycosylase-like protein|nr:MAG: lytic transglycosylase [Gammaproteobacteria bacterium HGW-Gammaproteobacteria-1]